MQILVWVSVQVKTGDDLVKYKLAVGSSNHNGAEARPSDIHTLDGVPRRDTSEFRNYHDVLVMV